MQDLQMPAAGLQLFTFKNLQLDSIKTSCRPPSRSDLGVKTGLLRLTQPRRERLGVETRRGRSSEIRKLYMTPMSRFGGSCIIFGGVMMNFVEWICSKNIGK